jgi:hypothetical protein
MSEINIHQQLHDFQAHVLESIAKRTSEVRTGDWTREALVDFHARNRYLLSHVTFGPSTVEALSSWVRLSESMSSGDINSAFSDTELGDAIMRIQDNLEGYLKSYGHLVRPDDIGAGSEVAEGIVPGSINVKESVKTI